MSHLSTERLAALADESPSVSELAHLAGCAQCTRERAAFARLAELAAADSVRIGAPLTSWERLAPALVANALIDAGSSSARVVRSVRRPWLQAAAAVLLIAGGIMAGRLTAGASMLPIGEAAVPVASAPIATAATAATETDTTLHFASLDEARSAQERSQAVYQTATAFLAQRDTGVKIVETPSAIRTRLAALERTNDVMGEALKTAPYDAVINDYYLSTLGQREATLRQLNAVMPASMRITSY